MKISVIIPYKEDRGFLYEAVKSVHAQTHCDTELIMSQSDATVGVNLNAGIEKCTGELITYLCDDDILPKNALKLYEHYYNGWDFCHANAINFSNSTKRIAKPDITHPTLADMIRYNEIHGGTVCYHRRIFDAGLRFDESLWTAEEYDFNLHLLSLGMKLDYFDAIVYNYRMHKDQKSRIFRRTRMDREDYINQIRKRYDNSEHCNPCG